jgi:uncharacterized protein YjiS (DUF1127 family)
MERVGRYSILDALWAMATAAAAKVFAAMQAAGEARGRAAAAQHLEHLSDHALRDIGLHRSQIRAALREPWQWS